MVGCRLISLGMALLTHLPERSVASHTNYQPGVYMPSLEGGELADTQARNVQDTEVQNISSALIDLENEEVAEVSGSKAISNKQCY